MQELKRQLRPAIPSIVKSANYTAEEKFQNEVLRPIIKLQNDFISLCFEHYLVQQKVHFSKFTEDQTVEFIRKTFNRNTRLKTDFRGLIIGLFTIQEYQQYLKMAPQLNKRINAMIQERVTSFYVSKHL